MDRKKMRWLFGSIGVASLVVIVYCTFGIARHLRQIEPENESDNGPVEGRGDEKTQYGVADPKGYQAILNRDLFKVRSVQRQPSDGVKKVLPPAKKKEPLRVKLWGTILDDARQPLAVIEEDNGRQRIVWEGETVLGGKIRKIHRRRVELEMNDRVEFLEMEDVASQAAKQPLNAASEKKSSAPAATADAGKTGFVVTEVGLDRMDAIKMLGKLRTTLREVRMAPNYVNGKMVGLKLSGIGDDSAFLRVGLQNNDVVKKVNGNAVRSVKDAVLSVKKATGGERVQIEVDRGGQPTLVNLSLKG